MSEQAAPNAPDRPSVTAWWSVVLAARDKLSPHKIRMAMAVRGANRHYRWMEISARHWLETAKRCGFPDIRSIMEEVIDRTPKLVEQTRTGLPRKFPVPIAESILSGTAAAARLLGEQLAKVSKAKT